MSSSKIILFNKITKEAEKGGKVNRKLTKSVKKCLLPLKLVYHTLKERCVSITITGKQVRKTDAPKIHDIHANIFLIHTVRAIIA